MLIKEGNAVKRKESDVKSKAETRLVMDLLEIQILFFKSAQHAFHAVEGIPQ